MLIREDSEDKVVEIWLSKDEAEIYDRFTELNARIAAYKANQNLVVVFKSGKKDLDQTLTALAHANMHLCDTP